ncbi:MAG TPA: RloB family protein [Nannocystis sp.]
MRRGHPKRRGPGDRSARRGGHVGAPEATGIELAAPLRTLERRICLRKPIERYLIVCEGEKTEPEYFRRFRVPADVAQLDVVGAGANTVSVVEKAIELRDDASKAGRPYAQAWAVFG